MKECKWCDSKIPDNEVFCDDLCKKQYVSHGMRRIIWNFALDMEQKMTEKDGQGYTHTDKSLSFLYSRLNEERMEVDLEMEDLPDSNVETRKELLDEGILCLLLREGLKYSGHHEKVKKDD